jgi:adenylate cyclase
VIQLTRVIGSSQARIAEAMLSTNERRRSGAATDEDAADLFAITADASVATQGKLLEYVWRRHLQAAIRRRLMSDLPAPGIAVPVAVGFADLVGFTALSQQVSDLELAEIVGRFEALAFDAVTAHGGRVAKMIGDEAMFVVDDVGDAVDTALSLAEAYADDEVLSDVRVGLAYGDVLSLEGDYYGPVVNLAHRIVNIAVPGAVVVSEAIVRAMEDDARFEFHSLRPRGLKDIGRVRLWRARRGHPSAV